MIDSEQTFDDDNICNAVGIVLNVRPNGETAAMTNEARTGLGDASGLEETSSSSEQADEEKVSFSLSPNPASDEIRLNIDSYIPLEGVIRFYDLRGRVISEQIVSPKTNALVIDITDWSDGIYFAKMTFNNGITTTKKVSVVH